jgi:hypothetical protein
VTALVSAMSNSVTASGTKAAIAERQKFSALLKMLRAGQLPRPHAGANGRSRHCPEHKYRPDPQLRDLPITRRKIASANCVG